MNDSDGFWDFSVRTYREPNVADACLALQDEHGLDVNLTLFCCWAGLRDGRCDDAVLTAALAFSAAWADRVVKPLRAVRTWMKAQGCQQADVPTESCMALREKIKAVELESERLQQNVLAALTEERPPSRLTDCDKLSAMAYNLRAYARHQRLDLDDRALSHLATILAAALSGTSHAAALSELTARR